MPAVANWRTSRASAVAEHRPAHLGEDRLVVARVRVEVVGQHRDAEEQRAEDDRHPRERGRRVLRLRPAERGHAVGDRLDAGERDGARREALEDQEQAERAAGLRAPPRTRSGSNGIVLMSPNQPKNDCVSPTTTSSGEDDDVEVGRDREDPARLLDAAQVGERDERRRARGRAAPAGRRGPERRDRDDRGDAGRDRHRDGEDVVDEQRRAGDERRVLAEVLAADDVGAAAARVGEDRLPVRRRDDREQDRDRDRDRDQRVEPEREARRPDDGDEEDLLGRVGGRRDGVGREDRQRDRSSGGAGAPARMSPAAGRRGSASASRTRAPSRDLAKPCELATAHCGRPNGRRRYSR